jgi:glucose uptake protein GlcU
MSGATVLGVLLAAASAFFNGSFGALSKVDAIQRAAVTPLHFNSWVAVGLILSTIPLLAVDQVFTPWGMLSGALFVSSTGCTFFAIDLLGVSVASAIWCGTAMLASYIWGLRINHEELSRPGFSIPALLLLVGGLAGIAFNGRLSEMIRDQREKEQGEESSEARQLRMEEERILGDPMGEHYEVAQRGPARYGTGCIAAVWAGLFGGLILAPKTFADSSIHAVAYLPSMALGVALVAPVLTIVVGMLGGARRLPSKASMQTAASWGIAAGIVWNLGNVLSILATDRVGVAVAYPLFQCGLLVAGMWGILLFDELERPCIAAYLLSGLALVLGATFLALAK